MGLELPSGVDQRLRELERRWRSSGATEDAAAYLAERLRREPAPAGDPDLGTPPPTLGLIGRRPPLTRLELERRASPGPAPEPLPGPDDLRTRLAVAAHCGDPIAVAALGQVAPPTDPLAGWTRGLAAISRQGAVAAAAGATQLALDGLSAAGFGRFMAEVQGWHPVVAAMALAEWLAAPSEETRGRLREAEVQASRAEGTLRGISQRDPQRPADERVAAALSSVAIGAATRAARVAHDPDPGWQLAEAIACAAIVARGPLTSLRQAEAMFIALGCMPKDGPVFGPVGDAKVLVQVRLAASGWALRGLLPDRPR